MSLFGGLRSLWPFSRARAGEKSIAPPVGGEEARKLAIQTNMSAGESGRPLWSVWTNEEALERGLKVCQWVYACCREYGDAALQLPWMVQERNKEGEWEKRPGGHWCLDRFNEPNEYYSGQEMVERQTYHLNLAGNLITQQINAEQRNRNDPTLELWWIDPDRVSPIPDEDDFLRGYELRRKGQGRGSGREIAPTEFVHGQMINSGSPYWGLAPLEVASRTVDTEVAALAWNFYQLKNRATGSLAFSTPHDLQEDAYNTLKERIYAQHVGETNAGKPWILSNGATAASLSATNEDLDWIDGKKMNCVEICAMFKVPPALVGFMEYATLNNFLEYKKLFYEEGVIPLFSKIANAYNRGWVRRIWGPDIRLVPDYSNVAALKQNWTEKLQQAESMFRMMIPLEVIIEELELGIDVKRCGPQALIGWTTSGLIPAADALMAGELVGAAAAGDGEDYGAPALPGDVAGEQLALPPGKPDLGEEDPLAEVRDQLAAITATLNGSPT